MNYRASTQTDVKLKNQKLILQLLTDEGPMTRADLAKKMRSTKPTISKNVEALLQDNKVLEIGKDDNSIGKKGVLLDLNKDVAYVLALDLSKNKFMAVLANIKGEWLGSMTQPLDQYLKTGEGTEVDLLSLLKIFINKSRLPVNRIQQVVMSYSGVIGHNDDLYITNLKYKETLLNQLKPYITDELNKPLIIKNDVNLAAVAEKRYGQYSYVENMYLLSGDIGVGVGIIIGNKLYEGDRNAAGEVGFILPIQRRDGSYSTIEERVSLHTLVSRYRKSNGPSMNFEDLVEGVVLGEPNALKIYQDVLEDLSVTITNIASILDIKRVVVTGRLFELKDTMIEDLNRIIGKMTPFETSVLPATVDKMSIRGAVALGVEAIREALI